jgi:putative hydrolase of the HAD superfamily
MIRAVFFDLAGTLLDVRGGVGAQYAAIAGRFGVDVLPDAIDRLFPDELAGGPALAFPGVPATLIPQLERQFWRDFVRRLFTRLGLFGRGQDRLFESFFKDLFEHFTRPEAWVVHPEVEPTLDALRSQGCRLGIISNFDSRAVLLLDRLGLRGWFDTVTLSSQAGAAKPDPALFALALAMQRVAASEALHVGDSMREDVAGARAAGLKAVLLAREPSQPPAGDVIQITSIAEVLDLLA